MRLLRGVVVAALVLTALTRAAGAQDVTYTIPGILAWTTAKTYAFEFAPERRTGESITRPFDGMNTRLRRTVTNFLKQKSTVTVAQVVGGQPSVNPGERNTTFRMFSGKTLAPGWSVKSVDMGGNFAYVDPGVRVGTSDLSFRVKLDAGKTATLGNVVLTGPPGADWRDAFSAPVRRDYVINGVVAWNEAKKYGFTFHPRESDTTQVSSPHDGVFTVTYSHSRYHPTGYLPGGCVGYAQGLCILGQIAGGNPSVPAHPYGMTIRFTMFGGKKLAAGWKVKSVDISTGTFIRQPVSGSDDLSFVMELTSSRTRGATAFIRSITLEGPSNAVSFADAFKNAP